MRVECSCGKKFLFPIPDNLETFCSVRCLLKWQQFYHQKESRYAILKLAGETMYYVEDHPGEAPYKLSLFRALAQKHGEVTKGGY